MAMVDFKSLLAGGRPHIVADDGAGSDENIVPQFRAGMNLRPMSDETPVPYNRPIDNRTGTDGAIIPDNGFPDYRSALPDLCVLAEGRTGMDNGIGMDQAQCFRTQFMWVNCAGSLWPGNATMRAFVGSPAPVVQPFLQKAYTPVSGPKAAASGIIWWNHA